SKVLRIPRLSEVPNPPPAPLLLGKKGCMARPRRGGPRALAEAPPLRWVGFVLLLLVVLRVVRCCSFVCSVMLTRSASTTTPRPHPGGVATGLPSHAPPPRGATVMPHGATPPMLAPPNSAMSG